MTRSRARGVHRRFGRQSQPGARLSCQPVGVPVTNRDAGLDADIKVSQTESHGREVILPRLLRRAMRARRLSEGDLTFVHPSTISSDGRPGTVALDARRRADIDLLIGPIGGGGLISGVRHRREGLKPAWR